MKTATVTLDGKQREVASGIVRALDLYSRLEVDHNESVVSLHQDDEVDIPLLADDHVIIRGGEALSAIARAELPEANPVLKNNVRITMNGISVVLSGLNSKITADELAAYDLDAVSPRCLYWVSGENDDIFLHRDLSIVVREGDSYVVLPSEDGAIIDLEKCSKADRKPPSGDFTYRIRVDGDLFDIKSRETTGEDVMSLAGKKYGEWSLNQKLAGGRRKPVDAEEVVDLAKPGVERFETVRRQAQQGA